MARTTEVAVEGLIELDTLVSVTPFIETSNQLVTRLCAPLVDDDVELELVERWLAAHFYAVRESRTSRETVGPITSYYQTKVDLGLDVTHYGQQAKILDSSGALAQWDEAVQNGRTGRAKLVWLGSTRYPDPPSSS